MSHTLAWLRRESAWQSRTTALVAAGLLPAAEPDGGDLLALAVKQYVVTSSDAALIRSSRLDGWTLREAGWRQGLSYETARKRRQRAEAALRAWLAVP
jgi:DNA-directed RNA polymerase specialized sigma24 family protein